MDAGKKPRSREKKVVQEGRGVETRGDGLGTGPVGNAGGYQDRKAQSAQPGSAGPAQPVRSSQPASPSRPAAGGPGQPGGGRPAGTSGSAQSPFSRPQPSQSGGGRSAGTPGSAQSPFSRPQPSQSGGGRPAGTSGSAQSPFSRPQPTQSGGGRPAGTSGSAQSPFSRPQPSQTGGGRPAGTSGGSSPRSGRGGGKLIMIVLALVVLLGGGKLTGLFGGGSDSNPVSAVLNTVSGTGGLPSSGSQSGSSQSSSSLFSSSGSSGSGLSSGSGGLTDLLSAFLGSSSSSDYDFDESPLSLLSGGSSSQSSASLLSGAAGGSVSQPDTSVSSRARAKYTSIQGGGRDRVTLLVYLCGSDLESRNGMGTSDLKEMAAASLGKNVNLLVFTGGSRRWRNNVISSSVNQIYQIQDGKLFCLEKDMGSASLTNPKTLTSFIRYGAEHFPANRMCLILWDHGGGSLSGFGYDEKTGASASMSLAGINSALKEAGQKFDFIGFDACLMATVENGLMLSQYADYMIASEETEPGVGWYYTNWLNALGKNPSMATVDIGKRIADDFVEVCARQCRGQGTTLSVVDLAELQATVPSRLADFSLSTNSMIQQQEYKAVSSARSNTREFARSTRIDQIDLVHFADNLGTREGKSLASALRSAVKYNRTGGSMNNANGLSIYFPYRQVSKLSQAVSTYQAIGMEEEYTRCIQEFASLELSGQAAAGTSLSGYSGQSAGMSSLLGSLLGGSSGGVGSSGSFGGFGGGISSSAGDISDLLGGFFDGSSGGLSDDLFGIFSGRTLTAKAAAQYLSTHHLDASLLVWDGNRITLSADQWGEVENLCRNVFVDNGKGYIDLGLDSEFTLDGNSLVDDFDGTWLSIGGQPIAYYYLGAEDDGEHYAITGYSPALLNGEVQVNLMLLFDNEHPHGVISGAEPVYPKGETETRAKNLIRIGQGDSLQFLCDFYDYSGNYQDSFLLGDPVVLDADTEIANTPIGSKPVKVTYCFTDYYQQRYWTPSR